MLRLMLHGVFVSMVTGCGPEVRWEQPIPSHLEPVQQVFRLSATKIRTPADFVLRTADEVREFERRAAPPHEPEALPPPSPGWVLVAAAAGQGRSSDPRIDFRGFQRQGDTVIVFVTVVRPVPNGRECPVTDDVRTDVIGGLVPDAAQVRIERIEGRRPC
jgi:hypothetical protein